MHYIVRLNIIVFIFQKNSVLPRLYISQVLRLWMQCSTNVYNWDELHKLYVLQTKLI